MIFKFKIKQDSFLINVFHWFYNLLVRWESRRIKLKSLLQVLIILFLIISILLVSIPTDLFPTINFELLGGVFFLLMLICVWTYQDLYFTKKFRLWMKKRFKFQ